MSKDKSQQCREETDSDKIAFYKEFQMFDVNSQLCPNRYVSELMQITTKDNLEQKKCESQEYVTRQPVAVDLLVRCLFSDIDYYKLNEDKVCRFFAEQILKHARKVSIHCDIMLKRKKSPLMVTKNSS